MTAVASFMVKIKMFAPAIADLNFASLHLHMFSHVVVVFYLEVVAA